MDKNKWFNGKPITYQTLMELLKENLEDKESDNSDLYTPWLLDYIATPYQGRKEDMEYLVEKLNEKGYLGWEHPQPNLQTVESILSKGEWNFSQREVKVSYRKSGRGTLSPSISLPNTWLNAMGVDEDDRAVIMRFDGEKITIEKEN